MSQTREPAHEHAANVAHTGCPACMKEGKQFVERGRRGFAREDVWSFDTYIAGVLAGGLNQLADNIHGCPSRLADQEGDVDAGCETWKAILTEMAAGFAAWAEDAPERSPDDPAIQRSLVLLREWWGDLWD